MRSAIGIDVGGTKVAGLRLAEDGAVLDRTERPTPADDVSATVETVSELAAELAAAGGEALGVGAAGMVDFDAGVLRYAPNLAWREIPLRDLLSERTGLPCVVDNDANVAAWGEYRFGAARGYRHVLVVTVGTGIGGGIVADGELFRGAHGFAAEIGHIIVEPDGPLCGCGNRGCWEQVASGRALDRLARAEVEQDPAGRIAALAAGAEASGRHVSEAARGGDHPATAIFAAVGRRLGEGIAGLVNILDPEVVIVGGGVAEEGAVLLDPARHAFLDAVEASEHRPEVPILAATLGNDAGAIGAAALGLGLLP
ncbi:MAG: ROK family glucokinase [Actinomycetota bacterium]